MLFFECPPRLCTLFIAHTLILPLVMLRNLYPAPAAPHASVMRDDLVAMATDTPPVPPVHTCKTPPAFLPALLLAAHFGPLVLN